LVLTGFSGRQGLITHNRTSRQPAWSRDSPVGWPISAPTQSYSILAYRSGT